MSPPAWFAAAVAALDRLLARSRVPEDSGHAQDVERWLLRLRPEASADWPLRLAARAHDVDRALPDELRVCRHDFADYDDFKAAHAANSARVTAGLMRKADAPVDAIHDVTWLVMHHEVGGRDARLQALCDADSLSFFTHNLPFYRLREGEQAALSRMRWGMARLSPRAKGALAAFPFADARMAGLVCALLNDSL